MATKPSNKLTLHDRLSRLTSVQAEKLLGPEGKHLLMVGAKFDINLVEQVRFTKKRLRVRFPNAIDGKRHATVTVQLADDKRKRLMIDCPPCETAEELKGAVLSLVLEDKLALGLSLPASEEKPWELLNEEELTAYALAQREQRAREERMRITRLDKSTSPWADYEITNTQSGKTYRAAIRGFARGEAYCSCRDFSINRLGTCKHLIKLTAYLKRKHTAAELSTPHVQKEFAVAMEYSEPLRLRLLSPTKPKLPSTLKKSISAFAAGERHDANAARDLLRIIRQLEAAGQHVNVYPDAEAWIESTLIHAHLRDKTAQIRRDPSGHPLRKELLRADLLPYQMDGIAFAAGAGRAIIADEMGLGKTIQGIGVATYLREEANITKVLVVCPASLKAQWKNEIERFSDLSVQLVIGPANERPSQYQNNCFFTICNYEQVLKDILAIEANPWDLIILDEGQRIKNWEAKTSRVIKGLQSTFALVLTGTPMENRLDELYSVVEFIDDQRLGPAYRFFNQHRIVNEDGKVIGFRKLDRLRELLAPVVLRRTRANVLTELPPRTTNVIRIPPSQEQLELHNCHMQTATAITRKRHLTEMDFIRLQKALLMCRLSANSTYLVDKQRPGYSTKLEKLHELIERLGEESDRKVILFTEWTRMLGLVEEKLNALGIEFVRLDGSIPQKKRQQLVHTFQSSPDCRFIIMTNAGSTGLNLQAADTVINVDLPWNPAILEQRIGRAHRMGQQRPVQVYILITEETIEENLLTTLSAKKELALAALDMDSQQESVAMESGIEELKRRLEVLLGAKPDAPVDESGLREVQEQAKQEEARKAKLAESGGQLLSAAFAFLDSALPTQSADVEASARTAALQAHFERGLQECVTRDEEGRPTLQFTLPDDSTLQALATTFAKFAALAQPKA